MVKRQVPIKTSIFSARAGFDCPRVLRLQRRVSQATAGVVVAKSNHVVERRRLKRAAEIDERLAVVVQFVEQTDFWIQAPKTLFGGLVAVKRVVEIIVKMPQHINSLKARKQRKSFREVMLVF